MLHQFADYSIMPVDKITGAFANSRDKYYEIG